MKLYARGVCSTSQLQRLRCALFLVKIERIFLSIFLLLLPAFLLSSHTALCCIFVERDGHLKTKLKIIAKNLKKRNTAPLQKSSVHS